ncbi:LysR substrate-binding domain-containing protein [Sphingomonas sp. BIUV-7]|uniref:LysR substrate-binding domain-containing protein n=1 Tax=Sphingomonas natans TaxID=3063330 RepID=A0ABT8Y4I8_9SPHN|nr:LysR substrate-binding domain-containing protein [Sphingomonas sp. BIUV-7]MDO6413236.1 LysR substrate-binding domain-containing protein [Sphingomonas sp. BIUV-7]
MELRHLRYFVRVAEELHFGRAAAKLGISQPPLSQQIRALEEELGIELFDRTSRRVRLTDAGVIFLVEARRTLAQARHAIAVARRIQQGEEGELSIGFASSVPFVPLVSRSFAQFRAEHPAIHLTLRELGRDAQFSQLREGQLDLGFIRGLDRPVLPTALIASLVQEEPLLVALREDHPLALENRPLSIGDIADQPFVMFSADGGAGFNEQVDLLFAREGREVRVVQEVNGLGSMLGLVAAALGITVISQSLNALRADGVVYRPLIAGGALSRLWLIRGTEPSPIARTFMRMLKSGDG